MIKTKLLKESGTRVRAFSRLLSVLLAAALWAGAPFHPAAAASRAVVNAADYVNTESPTGGIQEAIQALGPAGGVVRIPSGTYLLRQSIHLPSQVTLEGIGERPVLRKTPQAGSRLDQPAGAQSRSLLLQDASSLRAGDQIAIFDKMTVGWMHARAIITEVRGNEVILDRRVGRVFDSAQGAAVVNFFSAITGTQIADVVLRQLIIDGNLQSNPGVSKVSPRGLELGFNFAAINLVEATNARIENCEVIGWPADGISLQRGSSSIVTACVVQQCRGEGIHPGGGLKDSSFTYNLAERNLANGFYFCAGVRHVKVANNRFINNGRNGIGGLGSSGDTLNTVDNNVCDNNAMCGIEMVGGAGNTVTGNTCNNNSRSRPGRWSGILLSATTQSVVTGNRCNGTTAITTQKHGIEELSNCKGNVITGNECHGNKYPDVTP